jgi:hypothetical protein
MSYPITSSICINKGKLIKALTDTSDVLKYMYSHRQKTLILCLDLVTVYLLCVLITLAALPVTFTFSNSEFIYRFTCLVQTVKCCLWRVFLSSTLIYVVNKNMI